MAEEGTATQHDDDPPPQPDDNLSERTFRTHMHGHAGSVDEKTAPLGEDAASAFYHLDDPSVRAPRSHRSGRSRHRRPHGGQHHEHPRTQYDSDYNNPAGAVKNPFTTTAPYQVEGATGLGIVPTTTGRSFHHASVERRMAPDYIGRDALDKNGFPLCNQPCYFCHFPIDASARHTHDVAMEADGDLPPQPTDEHTAKQLSQVVYRCFLAEYKYQITSGVLPHHTALSLKSLFDAWVKNYVGVHALLGFKSQPSWTARRILYHYWWEDTTPVTALRKMLDRCKQMQWMADASMFQQAPQITLGSFGGGGGEGDEEEGEDLGSCDTDDDDEAEDMDIAAAYDEDYADDDDEDDVAPEDETQEARAARQAEARKKAERRKKELEKRLRQAEKKRDARRRKREARKERRRRERVRLAERKRNKQIRGKTLVRDHNGVEFMLDPRSAAFTTDLGSRIVQMTEKLKAHRIEAEKDARATRVFATRLLGAVPPLVPPTNARPAAGADPPTNTVAPPRPTEADPSLSEPAGSQSRTAPEAAHHGDRAGRTRRRRRHSSRRSSTHRDDKRSRSRSRHRRTKHKRRHRGRSATPYTERPGQSTDTPKPAAPPPRRSKATYGSYEESTPRIPTDAHAGLIARGASKRPPPSILAPTPRSTTGSRPAKRRS